MRKFRFILVWLWMSTAAVTWASEAVATAEGAAEPASPSLFSGSFMESIWTLVWFALLLVVLGKLAWKPLLQNLQARQERIQKEIEDAEKARKQAQQVLDEYRSKMADAERQGQELLNQRLKQAQAEAKEVENQSRKQIEQMKIRFEADMEREKIEVQDQFWQYAGGLVQNLGQEVFSKTLNDEDNQRLIQQAVDRLKQTAQSSRAV
jgi:F-type H+-transporting ATPase subunit b